MDLSRFCGESALKSLSILADELINHHRESMSAFDEFEICRDILESLLTGVCVIDLQKRIVYWSAGAERIPGHSRHEVIGRCCVGQALLHCDQTVANSAAQSVLWLLQSEL